MLLLWLLLLPGLALAGLVWVYWYMPETRGLSLEEIQDLFAERVNRGGKGLSVGGRNSMYRSLAHELELSDSVEEAGSRSANGGSGAASSGKSIPVSHMGGGGGGVTFDNSSAVTPVYVPLDDNRPPAEHIVTVVSAADTAKLSPGIYTPSHALIDPNAPGAGLDSTFSGAVAASSTLSAPPEAAPTSGGDPSSLWHDVPLDGALDSPGQQPGLDPLIGADALNSSSNNSRASGRWRRF